MSSPIRVLEIRSVRGTGGGPEKTILFGARQSDPARFAVTVCYIRDRRDRQFSIDQRAAALGVDYVEIPERHSFDASVWPALRKLVRERKIHIVHSHEYKTNLLALLLARFDDVMALSTVHGWFGRDTFRERLYYGVDKRLLTRFPRVIAVSGALRSELLAAGCRADRVVVVPNGIDHRAFVRDPGRRHDVRAALGLEDSDLVIGAVGRLEAQKRFDLLMEAFARIRTRQPRARLVIVGDGGLREQLASLHQRLQLGGSCLLAGHRQDVAVLHNAFDLFVQASDREGSPNVLLEAMALGTPIVATDVGGTTELISHQVHGLVVSPSDVTALVAALTEALNEPALASARAMAARRRIEEELSFDRRMDRVESIYEQLAGIQSSKPPVSNTLAHDAR
jgi:glycosyltransferase involved in cell wall biosynthesis